MYLNTHIFLTTGYARVLLFMFIRRELGGPVQDVYFSLHTVVIALYISIVLKSTTSISVLGIRRTPKIYLEAQSAVKLC